MQEHEFMNFCNGRFLIPVCVEVTVNVNITPESFISPDCYFSIFIVVEPLLQKCTYDF